MGKKLSSAVCVSRRRPIAACVASIFALSAPAAAIADSWIVDSCDEDSFPTPGVNHGTLRYALLTATSPAVIDLTGLTGMAACPSSKISLTTGALKFTQPVVTINGPGSSTLSIDASGLTAEAYSGNAYGNQRVFSHYGNGTLKIQDLAVTGGHSYRGSPGYAALGGCILSNGAVELAFSSVSGCFAKHANGNPAYGGAIHAAGAVTMNGSSVRDNYARSDTGNASGGGVFAGGDITLTSVSTVHDNEAKSVTGNALGGGLFAQGKATLTSVSFVYDNKATCTDTGCASVGGGVYAQSDTNLSGSSEIKYNSATSHKGSAVGGGAFGFGSLTLSGSSLRSNSAISDELNAVGGGAYVNGDFESRFSTIRENEVSGATAAAGGGLYLSSSAFIANSTISGNTSNKEDGGIRAFTFSPALTSFVIRNSTISGNTAGTSVGGLFVNAGTVKFYNSTIAFNTDVAGSPGVMLSAVADPTTVTLQSTLMSNNTFGENENDLAALNQLDLVFNAGSANNLIRATAVTGSTGLPAGTLFTACPLLGPLHNNGGLTQTHTLRSRSPAIDQGNNVVIDPDTLLLLAHDQRGSAVDNGEFDYLRVSGPPGGMNPKADIGAYEVQQNDVIFDTDLEGCIDLI